MRDGEAVAVAVAEGGERRREVEDVVVEMEVNGLSHHYFSWPESLEIPKRAKWN